MFRQNNMRVGFTKIIAAVLLALSAGACSTTSRLGKDDVLYTGVKSVRLARNRAIFLRIQALMREPKMSHIRKNTTITMTTVISEI